MLHLVRDARTLPAFLVSGCLLAGCSGASNAATVKGEAHDAATAPDAARPDAATGKDAGADGSGGPTITLITEPDQGMTPVYDFISSAKKTLDMTMYELDDTTATGLLLAAAKNGVTVRVILDQNLEMKDNTAAYDALGAGNVQVHWADPTYAATHQKTITVDGTTSAVMSLNFAAEFYKTSRDFALLTTDPNDVAAIEAVFEKDFSSTAVTPSAAGGLVWSPTNSESSLVGLINGAKTSLVLENEEMSADEVVVALENAAKRGVKVEVVMTASMSWDTNFGYLTTAGVKVVTYLSYGPLYIHAKVILADYGTSDARLFVGSENFSDASLTENRELGLFTSDATVMTAVNKTLASDLAGGTPYP